MKQLIINADDFGRHRLINEAVEKAYRQGCLTSTTIMAGGKAFDDAVDIALRNPELGVGIHFTLANGFPVMPAKKIPSLVTREGYFHPNYSIFAKLYMQGKINRAEVQAELDAQLEKVMYSGIRPTHFDSHQHLHHFPGILGVAIKLAKKARINAMRVSSTKVFSGNIDGLGTFIGRLGLSSLAKIAANTARKSGMATPEHFIGNVSGESITKEFMVDLINNLEEGTTEVMLHPGVDNKILQYFCDWDHDFEGELEAVTSPKVVKLIEDKRVYLVNFSDLRAPK
ncbi:MAG: ChbG/HpnK family deacetylase [Selenomonadaceae bacterium]|nr:ChbG/HpnK family deacetylase [Selenomonadaceae bacterium]